MVRKDRSWLGHQSLRNPVHATITLRKNIHSLELALLVTVFAFKFRAYEKSAKHCESLRKLKFFAPTHTSASVRICWYSTYIYSIWNKAKYCDTLPLTI